MPKIAKKKQISTIESRKRNSKSSNSNEVTKNTNPYANYYGTRVQGTGFTIKTYLEFLELNPQQSVRGLIEQM